MRITSGIRCLSMTSLLAAGLAASPSHAGGVTTRVSVSSAGVEGDGPVDFLAFPDISADGRFVTFTSEATNMVPGDTNGGTDAFVRDRLLGQTTRVSVSSSGGQSSDFSYSGDGQLSADGRFVAFNSDAENLVPGDTNLFFDVFVHDRMTGETTRVSVSSTGQEGNGDSISPDISADGRYVIFESLADNLVSDDTNSASDVFVHDRMTGETTRVSLSSMGEEGSLDSYVSAISGDGRFAAFTSDADNLVPDDNNQVDDAFIHDRMTGQTIRASVSSTGEEANGGQNLVRGLSADGRRVVFLSLAENLVPDDLNGTRDVFVHDRVTHETFRASVSSQGEETNGSCGSVSISGDGNRVGFRSNGDNLVPDDNNNIDDAFVHDLTTGQTVRVSVHTDGTEGDRGSFLTALNSDGTVVAFWSEATNLVDDDTNFFDDIFVHELPTACLGDVDGDNDVDLSDLGIVLADFGCTGGGCAGDADGDGDTDLSDLGIVLANFGTPCP